MLTNKSDCSKCGYYTVRSYKGRYRDFKKNSTYPEFVTIDISDSRSLRRLKRWFRKVRQQAKRQAEKERKHKDA